MSKVFISSMAVITCIGTSIDEFWAGINRKVIDFTSIDVPIPLPQNIDKKISRRMDRFSKMSLSLSKLVLEASSHDSDYSEIGTVFNTGFGPLQSNIDFRGQIESVGVDMVSPTLFTNTVLNAGVGRACLQLKLKGPSTMLMGSNAISYSYDLIKSNKAHSILCCGVDEYVEDLHHSFKSVNYTTKEEQFLCRPLDLHRDGTAVTEGASGLLIESEATLQARADQGICEILGYANAIADEFRVMDSEDSDSRIFADVMSMAIANAHIDKAQIDGIVMAAGGGKYADHAEARAIHQTFGSRGAEIPVASIKGAVGETLGASLILNTIAGALAIEKQELPLTSGCLEPDSSLNLNVIYEQPQSGKFKYLLINGFDISGCLFSIVIGDGRS